MKRIMGKAAVSTALVTAMLSMPFSTVGAAASAKTAVQAAAVNKLTMKLDGKNVTLRSMTKKGTVLVAVKDAAKYLGATIYFDGKSGFLLVKGKRFIQINTNSQTAYVNGEVEKVTVAPKIENSVLYMELNEIVTLLDGDVYMDAVTGEKVMSGFGMLDASNANLKWIDTMGLLVSFETDDGFMNYKLNPYTKNFQVITDDPNASDLAVSPSGKKAAYANDKGDIYIIDMNTFASQKIATDDSIKNELKWSSGEDKVYFIQGDKGTTICQLTIADASIKKIVDDKVNYKSDMKVSKDGTKFLYSVSQPGVISGSTQDDVAIDNSNTEAQLYSFDSAQKDAKPVKLTTTTENKTYADMLPDGRFVYISSDTENADKPSVLKVVGPDLKTTDLAADLEVIESIADQKGSLTVLGWDKNGDKGVFQVRSADGTYKKLFDVSEKVSDIEVSDSGNIAAVIDAEDGQIAAIYTNGKPVQLTK